MYIDVFGTGRGLLMVHHGFSGLTILIFCTMQSDWLKTSFFFYIQNRSYLKEHYHLLSTSINKKSDYKNNLPIIEKQLLCRSNEWEKLQYELLAKTNACWEVSKVLFDASASMIKRGDTNRLCSRFKNDEWPRQKRLQRLNLNKFP